MYFQLWSKDKTFKSLVVWCILNLAKVWKRTSSNYYNHCNVIKLYCMSYVRGLVDCWIKVGCVLLMVISSEIRMAHAWGSTETTTIGKTHPTLPCKPITPNGLNGTFLPIDVFTIGLLSVIRIKTTALNNSVTCISGIPSVKSFLLSYICLWSNLNDSILTFLWILTIQLAFMGIKVIHS